jgi:epoxyqueuosine reductase
MPEAVEPLAGALRDPSALVRTHAAWALGQIGTTEARDGLTAARSVETDPFVLEEIERAVHCATADERR